MAELEALDFAEALEKAGEFLKGRTAQLLAESADDITQLGADFVRSLIGDEARFQFPELVDLPEDATDDQLVACSYAVELHSRLLRLQAKLTVEELRRSEALRKRIGAFLTDIVSQTGRIGIGALLAALIK